MTIPEGHLSNKQCYAVTYQITRTKIVEARSEQQARDVILRGDEGSNVEVTATRKMGKGPWYLGGSD